MEVYTLTQAVDSQEPTGCEFLGFPGGASGKESACQCRRQKNLKFDPWVGKIPWRREHGYPFKYSCLENPWTAEPGGLQSVALQKVGCD